MAKYTTRPTGTNLPARLQGTKGTRLYRDGEYIGTFVKDREEGYTGPTMELVAELLRIHEMSKPSPLTLE